MKTAIVPLLLLIAVTSLFGQNTSISDLDGLTPEGLQPGSPAGSYVLSGLDTVNLYNGSTNLTIPLLQIGGRGEAGYAMLVKYNTHWDGIGYTNEYPCSLAPCWAFNTSGWANWDYSYRPAGIGVRHLGRGSYNVTSNNTVSCTVYQSTLTRLAIGLADGTEVMLVDTLTGGNPQSASPSSCSPQGFDRGKMFVATDGSAMTFVADTSVHDSTTGGPVSGDSLTGTLYFRDGRQFHFGSSIISGLTMTAIDRVQDRNGNRTTFAYNSPSGFQYGFSVTDPTGRVTTVSIGKTFGFTDDPLAGCNATTPCNGIYDQITYNGASGQPRTITIYRRPHWYDRLSTLQSVPQPSDKDLFGGYASTSTRSFVWALSKIVLPDGHMYQFRYNQYAEIARLDLPTGGRYEFDWINGYGTDPFDVCPANPENKCPIIRAPSFLQPPNGYDQLFAIYRRVKERREYVDGTTSWTRRTTYDVLETTSNQAVDGDSLGSCGSSTNATFVSGSCTKVSLREYGTQGQLAAEDHYFYGAVSNYQTLFPQSGWYPWWLEGKEFRSDTLQPVGTMLRKELQVWQERAIPSWWFFGIGPQPALDPRIGSKDLIIDNGKMARKLFGYATDNTNNIVDLWEYDYGSTAGSQGPMLRHTHTDFSTAYNNPTGGVYLRELISSQKLYSESDVLVAQTDYFYDETSPSSQPGILQNVAMGSQRGNRTRTRRWRNTDGAWLTTTVAYDVAGNVLSRQNPRGYTKSYAYTDCPGTYAFVARVINEAGQTTAATHDCSLGTVTSITDPNLFQTTAYYGGAADGGPTDVLDRLTKVIRANAQQITYRYSPDLTTLTTAADQEVAGPNQYTAGDQKLQSVAIRDGLGRPVETRLYTSATTYISTKKDLDAFGHTMRSYNPVEMSVGQAYTNTQATTYTYDALGRITASVYADGSRETLTRTGDTVRQTDPAGKQHTRQLDALDRIVAVTEDPLGQALVTTYQYDAFNNLKLVIQGAQTRSFTYNSLKQLRSTTDPETGAVVPCDSQMVSVCYTYDNQPPNDTLKTKTAGGVVTTFTYDPLDRILKTTYSDGSPQVDYAYDQIQIGCLNSVSNTVARTVFSSFTPGCGATTNVQTVGTQSYPFSYAYNLASALITEFYPSNRSVSYHYDRAGRTDRVAGQPTDSSSFATNITYAPHGALASLRLGVTSTNPGWNELWQYNERLQPASVTVGAGLLSLGFSYCPGGAASCTTNNGNLLRQTITRNGVTWTQNYLNDAMNRLTSAQESVAGGSLPWTETYDYDGFGNRWVTSYPGLPAPNAETPTAQAWYLPNNRIAGWDYSDGRGNITAVPFMQRSFSYDGENRQTVATVNGVTATYAYDGNGRRIKKTVNGVITTYVYDALGRLAAEYSSNVATGVGTQYRHVDHLGSTRLVVNANGSPVLSGCHDFRPFGQELLAGTDGRDATCFPSMPAASLEFTGKERDGETNLDYFGARYFSSGAGRFTSVDPSRESGDASNPQSWNRYTYTYNNPLKYIDPNGKWPTEIHSAIFNGAFKGLTDTQLKSLGSGSFSVDFSLVGQILPSRAYQHGMRAPGETDQDLHNNMTVFVLDHELAAEDSALDAGGIDGRALREFGKAMHPLMDSTSPAHAGKVYAGIPSLPGLGTIGVLLDAIGIWQHTKEEAKITIELYHKNIDVVRTEYLKAFGQEAFFKATGCKKVEECPYDIELPEALREQSR